MQLTARAIDQRVGFRKACTISAIGRIAEILPLPGGAMVRGAALVRAGAGWGESAMIISLTAVLTLSMAAALAGVPLIMSGGNLGYIVFTAGAAGALMSAGWMIRRSGIGVTVAMLVSRIAIIALGVVHIDVAFNAIGVDVKIIDAALFVVASSLGGSLSIVPAGIGLSEAIAAALAMLVDIPSGAAFLAVAIVRMCSLAVNGLVATLAGIGERQLTEERRHVKD
ncbi:lysylphosphatidylglycerol synthase domain-containing protein [Hyphococcus sp.]|uniref:lysylphosphatidylglycerol synthase domain-containing protein n=1 Tax=Hyphococcus sp. TaxID=2038636 RepID=UPI003CCC1168